MKIKNKNKKQTRKYMEIYFFCLVYSNQTLIFQIVLDFKLKDELFILNKLIL
jgi:hypothetical protein